MARARESEDPPEPKPASPAGQSIGAGGGPQPPADDVARALHELRVHQIELEMQNEELRRAQEALEASRTRYHDLFDGAPVAYVTLTDQDMIRQANRRALGLLGPVPTMVGERFARFVAAEDQNLWHLTRKRILELGEPQVCELRMWQAGARRFWARIEGSAVQDEAGTPVLRLAISDVSEQKRVAAELQDAARKKDDFIATLAHELRNPLAPISNAVTVLGNKTATAAEVKWCTHVIARQVRQMARLLEDLLDVTRLTRNKVTLRKQPLELARPVLDAVEAMRPFIEEHHHELTLVVPEQPIMVDADAARLTQVFMNLLNNAAKYTPDGGRIALMVALEDHEVAVTVEDSGIGIETKDLPRLFEMFSQLEPALERSQGGLGIGLSLVRGLVELHGGYVTATSPGRGRGSVFQVHLPLALHVPPAPVTKAKGPQACPCNILVVDDNRDSAKSLALMLSLPGNDVQIAFDGPQALAMAEQHRPDIVLLDLGMPGLNGYEVCRHIRQQSWGRDMVVVACTGWGQKCHRQQAEEAGFDRYMVKPIDPDELRAILSDRSRHS